MNVGLDSDGITHILVTQTMYYWEMEGFTTSLGYSKDIDFGSNKLTHAKDDRHHDSLLLRRDYSERLTWFQPVNNTM